MSSDPAAEPETNAGALGLGTRATSCDSCGAVGVRKLIETGERRFGMPGRFRVVRCQSCRLVRTDPRPQDLAAYYPSAAYYSYAPPSCPSAGTRRRVVRAYRAAAGGGLRRWLERALADRLTQGLPPGPPGRILDVGCGSGAFLLALREAGWDCHGIEIDEAAVTGARAAGLENVRAGELTDARFPAASFDAVRFWHSLEHVGSPREQLEEARRVLRPGGSLTVGVPNFASALARTTRERWFYLDLPRHLWHFEPRTLRALVQGCGFEVTRMSFCSESTPLLGTLDFLVGRGERLVSSRPAWLAALPVAALLDVVRLGDALWLEGRGVTRA